MNSASIRFLSCLISITVFSNCAAVLAGIAASRVFWEGHRYHEQIQGLLRRGRRHPDGPQQPHSPAGGSGELNRGYGGTGQVHENQVFEIKPDCGNLAAGGLAFRTGLAAQAVKYREKCFQAGLQVTGCLSDRFERSMVPGAKVPYRQVGFAPGSG